MMLSINLLSILAILCYPNTRASVLVADNSMSRMVELNADAPFCALYDDRGVIQRMVLGADPKKVRQMSSNLVADLEETCKESKRKGRKQTSGSGLIYPGTKWCGPGSIAVSYDDLGTHSAEDACCREHDYCPVVINPHACLNGICNHSPYTRSHCDCDAKFRRCLQSLNTEVANTLGALFFNVIQVTCFKERRPCSQWQSCELETEDSLPYTSDLKPKDKPRTRPLMWSIRTVYDLFSKAVNKKLEVLHFWFNLVKSPFMRNSSFGGVGEADLNA